MSADQIQPALRPLNGSLPEVSRKTFHTYLSGLRQSIGADHLPDANAGGYQIVGVESDWARFQALAREADRTDGEESLGHRRAALALVRGVPFEGVTAGQYEWVFNEQLASEMTAAIATCALRLANDLFERGDYVGIDEAVRAGLRAAPDDADLWRIGAQALAARQEGRALRRHLGDAERHLEPEEMARLTDVPRSSRRLRRAVAEGEGPEQRLGPTTLLAHRLVGLPHRRRHLGQRALSDPGVVDDPGLTEREHAPSHGLLEQVRGALGAIVVKYDVDVVERDELRLSSTAQALRTAHLGPDGVDHGLGVLAGVPIGAPARAPRRWPAPRLPPLPGRAGGGSGSPPCVGGVGAAGRVRTGLPSCRPAPPRSAARWFRRATRLPRERLRTRKLSKSWTAARSAPAAPSRSTATRASGLRLLSVRCVSIRAIGRVGVVDGCVGCRWCHGPIAPNRVPRPTPQTARQHVPQREILCERLSSSWGCGTWCGSLWGTFVGTFGAASSNDSATRWATGVAVAPAEVAPLPVEVGNDASSAP